MEAVRVVGVAKEALDACHCLTQKPSTGNREDPYLGHDHWGELEFDFVVVCLIHKSSGPDAAFSYIFGHFSGFNPFSR